MIPPRIASLLVLGFCLLNFKSLSAQEVTSPFGEDKQYSADMEITTDKGQHLTQKIYGDSGKVRTEMNAQGMQVVSILRPDEQKVYTVMPSQKMVMVMPYDPEKNKTMAAALGPEGKFELIGPDTVDGVACMKYKVTNKDNKVMFFWLDAGKAPLKMTADDGSVTILWRNYKVGPQDPTLFEPPADYQVMQMPGAAVGGQ